MDSIRDASARPYAEGVIQAIEMVIKGAESSFAASLGSISDLGTLFERVHRGSSEHRARKRNCPHSRHCRNPMTLLSRPKSD